MKAMFNQICRQIAKGSSGWPYHWAHKSRWRTGTRKGGSFVVKWRFCAVAMLICLIERARGQFREHHMDDLDHRPIMQRLYISEPYYHQSSIDDSLSPRAISQPHIELRPGRFNLRGTTTLVSFPKLSADAWEANQYRSINARSSNPKSPLSPRAFFSSSAQRRQLELLAAANPTSSLSGAAFASSPAASVPTAGKQATVNDAAVGQIDRVSMRPSQSFHSVASENIDNAETIEDAHKRVGIKRTADEKGNDTAGEGDPHRARRISRRKLEAEHYDNLVAHVAPAEETGSKESSLSPATISTRGDKQANDATAESKGTRDRLLDTALGDSQMKNQTEAKYVNEQATEDDRPAIGTDGKNNRDNGTVEHGGARSNLPSKEILVEKQYVADQGRSETGALMTAITGYPGSTKNKASDTALGGEQSGDNSNEDGSDSSTESDDEQKDNDSLEEEEDFKINQYSSSVPALNSKNEKQKGSSLVSKDYSKRDRGFGFIKAWAWDRAENYQVKKSRERSTESKSKQSGYAN